MKKQNIFPIVGITSAVLVILSFLLTRYLFLYKISIKDWMMPYNLFSPFFIICIFIALKNIIVNRSNLDSFKIIIYLILFCQIAMSLIIWIIYLKILNAKFFVIPIVIAAIFMSGLYIWFFLSISKTDKSELKYLPFLQYFAIALMILLVLRVVVTLKMPNTLLDKISQLSAGIPYIFLIFFFSGHIDKSHDKLRNGSNA